MQMSFNDDVTLLDRYQSFSSEVLRLALLSLAAVGFLISTAENSPAAGHISLTAKGVKPCLIVGIISLSLSIFAALIHRYYSTDSMALHLEHTRRPDDSPRKGEARKGRDRAFEASKWSILGAPVLLAVGAALVGTAFILSLQVGPKP